MIIPMKDFLIEVKKMDMDNNFTLKLVLKYQAILKMAFFKRQKYLNLYHKLDQKVKWHLLNKNHHPDYNI